MQLALDHGALARRLAILGEMGQVPGYPVGYAGDYSPSVYAPGLYGPGMMPRPWGSPWARHRALAPYLQPALQPVGSLWDDPNRTRDLAQSERAAGAAHWAALRGGGFNTASPYAALLEVENRDELGGALARLDADRHRAVTPDPQARALFGPVLGSGPGVRPAVEAGLGNVMPWTTPVDPRLGVTPPAGVAPPGPLRYLRPVAPGEGFRPAVEAGLGTVQAGPRRDRFAHIDGGGRSAAEIGFDAIGQLNQLVPTIGAGVGDALGRARDATSEGLQSAVNAAREAIAQSEWPGWWWEE